MSPAAAARAHRVDVTESAGDFGPFDFASAFAVTVGAADQRSPEQWARDMFERAPWAVRSFVVVGWHTVAFLRLGPRPSVDHVIGWKIVDNRPESITLDVPSPLLAARKIVRVEGDRVVATTFVHYRRRSGRAIWSSIAPIHHLTEPHLLGHAVRRRGTSPV